MSAAGRGAERRLNDAYYTPPTVAEACVRTLCPLLFGLDDLHVIEPSVGGGAFARAMRSVLRAHVVGIDINPDAPGAVDCDRFIAGDWLTMRPVVAPDVILGNPPYREAEAHVLHALEVVRHGGVVAFLLRLAFLEGQSRRRSLWAVHPPYEVHTLSARPSFTGGGTDATAYGWFTWKKGHNAGSRLTWI